MDPFSSSRIIWKWMLSISGLVIGRRKPMGSVKILFRSRFVYHKFHVHWPVFKPNLIYYLTPWSTAWPNMCALHAVHFTLFTAHVALCTVHCVLYTLPYTLNTLHYALYTVYCTLYTSHYALHTLHYALCTVYCALHAVHFALCTVHYTLFTLHCTLWGARWPSD